ncbi:MAG: TetR/AcrR family transcriptional regulator, partial [Rhodospirillaceae bacterium]|nr:TetR/AcrR family transcriptional regulator [Rhodospirillaceae bacterium]
DVRELNTEAVLQWRQRFRERFDLIAERYPPKIPVDFDALADMVSVLVDGGIIISKVLRDKEVLPKQIMLLRDYVRVIFLGT